MKKTFTNSKLFILIIFFLICYSRIWATPIISSVTPTNGVCVSDCKITVNATNLTSPVKYALINYPNPGDISQQNENEFIGLQPGTYTVGVYDATTGSTPVTKQVTVTTSYVEIYINQDPKSSYNNSIYCDYNGTLTVYAKSGRAPYRVKIIGPVTKETTGIPTSIEYSGYTFTGLPPGNYEFEVEDACGQIRQNKPGGFTTVVSTSEPKVPFISFSATNINVHEYCNEYKIQLYDTKIDGKALSTSTSFERAIEARVEYPINSGQYTEWTKFYGGSATWDITNIYDPNHPLKGQCKVQIKNPCITDNILTSGLTYIGYRDERKNFQVDDIRYTTNNPSMADFCTYNFINSVGARVTELGCYKPEDFKMTIYFKGNIIYSNTMSGSGNTASIYYADLEWGEVYDVEVTGPKGYYNKKTITATKPTTKPPALTISYTNAVVDCNFTRGGIGLFNLNIGHALPITYTIVSPTEYTNRPAITRAGLTGLSGSGEIGTYLWTDLKPGLTYRIKADYGCGVRYDDVKIVERYSKYEITSFSYEPSGVICGRYVIKAKYRTIGISPTPNTPEYDATIFEIASGKVVSYESLIGGKYKVEIWTSISGCLLDTREITLPDYITPKVDIPLSGGIACSDKARMTITATGSKTPFLYRYKVQGASDATYTPAVFQSDNYFDNIAPGKYTVQVKDQCGSITTQDIQIFNSGDQFATIIGEVAPGKVCMGKPFQFGVLSIGPVQWHQWFFRKKATDSWTQLTSRGNYPYYDISSASDANKGFYKVVIHNGTCQLESQIEITDVLPPASAPVISGPSTICQGDNVTLTAGIDPSYTNPVFQWYKDGMLINNANTSTYIATAAGEYTVVVVPGNACTSPLSSKHIIQVTNNPEPPLISGLQYYCPGGNTTLTATYTQDYSYTWYKDGTQVAITNNNTYNANAAGNYTVKMAKGGNCQSGFSNTFVVKGEAPATMYWNKNAQNSNWNDPANWMDINGNPLNIAPLECTDVHIPGNAGNYPSLDIVNTPRGVYGDPKCNNITYHFGGETAQPQLLNYKRAFIQYNFGYFDDSYSRKTDGDNLSAPAMNRGQWYALATPLKKIATGDFSVGGYPNIWQKWFMCSKATTGNFSGKWYTPANQTATDICSDQRHAIGIWTGEYLSGTPGEGIGYHKNLNALKGILEMPYFENPAISTLHRLHHYDGITSYFDYYRYDVENVPIVPSAGQSSITRGQEAYRFIFDNIATTVPDGKDAGKKAFKITVPAGEEIMVGNPFVSTFDFRKFYEANEPDPSNPAKLEGCYRLYINNVWQEYSYSAGAASLTEFIAPLQAFFICTKGTGTVDLYFPFETVSVARKSSHQLKAGFQPQLIDDALYITAHNHKGSNSISLGLDREGEQNIYKLFYDNAPEVPQIYFTDKKKVKNAVQFEGDREMEIPLGIQCTGEEYVELSFSNIESLYTGLLWLEDRFTGKKQDLFSNPVYGFNNIPGSFNKERFLLHIGKRETPSNIEMLQQNSIKIYSLGKTLYASANNIIQEVTVTNAQGQKVITAGNVNSNSYNKLLQVAPGVYLVHVKDNNGNTRIGKVIIN